MSDRDVMKIRNAIITSILLANAQCAGPIRNMTLSEFRAAKREGKDLVVQVRNHKTFSTNGPARLVLSNRQH